jgi:hypothetical protein
MGTDFSVDQVLGHGMSALRDPQKISPLATQVVQYFLYVGIGKAAI